MNSMETVNVVFAGIGGQGVIANEAPDEEALDACEKAGEALAKAAK